jgi:acyl-coenzyme A thioesterase PaaI-like protein
MTDARRVSGHLLRELGFTVAQVGDRLHGTATFVPEMAVPGTDVLRASILATWADTLTGLLAVEDVAPRVPVTLQLDVQMHAPPRPAGRVHAVSRRVKAGRSVIVAAVDFTDDAGTPLATGTGLFMVAPDPTLTMPSDLRPLEALAVPGGPLTEPFAQRARCRRRSPGVAVLECDEDGLNASRSLNGGLVALVVEEAALSAQPGRTLAAMALRYLRPVRVGPAVATAAVYGPVGEVTVTDGPDGALSVSATTRSFDTVAGEDRACA